MCNLGELFKYWQFENVIQLCLMPQSMRIGGIQTIQWYRMELEKENPTPYLVMETEVKVSTFREGYMG